MGKDKPLLVATALGIGIVVVQLLVGLAIYRALPSWSERGTFGDMFGAVKALFSGLALAGIIYAILLQRADLALQRLELELTRQELAKSAEAQSQAARLLADQLNATREATRLAQAQADAAAAPVLRWVTGGGPPGDITATIRNVGATVRDLVASVPGSFSAAFEPAEVLENGATTLLRVRYDDNSRPPWILQIGYTDSLGRRLSKSLHFEPHQGRLAELTAALP